MFELTDQAFARVRPLLPADSRRGKPWREHRQVLGGIVWKLHTGRPWRDVPGRFGPWQTCHGRLRRWQRDGTWPRIWALLAADRAGSGDHRRGQAPLAAAPVAAARAGLMAAPPPRPPQHLPGGGWPPPHQGDQQPARLGGGDPHQVRSGWLWQSWQFCALSRPPRPPDRRRRRPGRGPPPGTPAPAAPGWPTGTSSASGGPDAGPGRKGPCWSGSVLRSAMQNAPMNADQVGQTPILGREGLLRLVEVVERLRARARGEEGGSWTTGEDPGPTGGDQAVLDGAAGGQPPGGGRVAGGPGQPRGGGAASPVFRTWGAVGVGGC
jgi:transposase